MNSKSIKSNIEIIANVGVLLGIILLAYEVNQNNQLMVAEANMARMENRSETTRELAQNGEMMDLRLKSVGNGELTPAEELRLFYDAVSVITELEWTWEQYENGNISSLPTNGWSILFQDLNFARLWPHVSVIFDPDFVAFMEEDVISQLE